MENQLEEDKEESSESSSDSSESGTNLEEQAPIKARSMLICKTLNKGIPVFCCYLEKLVNASKSENLIRRLKMM